MHALTSWLGVAGMCAMSAHGQLIRVAPDGDVASPVVAIEKIRAMRSAGSVGSNETVRVLLAPGRYELEKTLEITGEVAPVAFEGPDKGVAEFSGGRRLGPFAAGADGVWRCRVPDGLDFEQLWVNGTRATRAKSPNKFYHYIKDAAGEEVDAATGATRDLGRRAFFAEQEPVACLAKTPPGELKSVVIHVWWAWDDEYRRVSAVDVASGRITLENDVGRNFFQWGTWCPRFTIENCRAALDAPGEWFLDRKAHELLYIPREGETPERTFATAPAMPRVVSVCRARGVTFRNLRFVHNGWKLPPLGFYAYQSAYFSDAAVVVEESSDVAFESCRVSHTADYGMWFGKGARDSSVVHTMFDDLGAGGVRVGSRSWKQGDPDESVAQRITVDDCIIHDGGHVFPAGTGVFVTFAKNCKVTHNEICDLFYSGVCCGYRWGYAPTPNRDNEISWNHIHHLGKGVLSDMGFIYTLGDSRGTVVAGNHGHDIFSYGYTGSGGTGLYPDEGSRGILWTSNLIHHTKTSALNLHYGRDNIFRNNIFAFPTKPGVSVAGRWRVDNHTSLVASNNVFVWSGGQRAWAGPRGARSPVNDLIFGSNLWWSPDPIGDDAFNGGTFASWQKKGVDAGSVVADPMFRDWKHGDWRLRPESPAFGIGFKEWDYSLAGVRKGDASWRKRADSLVPASYDVAPIPPRYKGMRSYRTGFETRRPGTFPYSVFDYVGIGRDYGYVMESSAAAHTGKQSLEFRDFPDLKPSYLPHVHRGLRMLTDTFILRFAIKSDRLADFEFLFREWTAKATNGEYAEGPNVYIKGTELGVRGRRSKEGPVERISFDNYVPGQWSEVEFTVHRKDDGYLPTWDFAVVNAQGVRKGVKGLYCPDTACINPGWIGFVSAATCETTTFVDDFSFDNVGNDIELEKSRK